MFAANWSDRATADYENLCNTAARSRNTRKRKGRKKSSRQEGLFKQVNKVIRFLLKNPKHPGLQTHPFESMENPFDASQEVFVAYAQNDTPGAYRVFWCYGPEKQQITILAITSHP